MAKLAAGDGAPEFTVVGEDGKTVSLADYAGKRFVLYFYPRDDTPGCTIEAQQFTELNDAFLATGVEVLGVSPDDGASHQRFRERHGLRLSLASDPEHKAMEQYGAWGEKTRYGRTSLGVIRSTFLIGPDGTIEKAWYNVRADGHAAKVLAAVGS